MTKEISNKLYAAIFGRFGRFLIKIGRLFNFIGLRLYQPSQHKRVVPWLRDQGDKKFRLGYNLDENSLVFDVGGYEGQWTSDIFAKYGFFIHIFEPVHEFADQIKHRFERNKKVCVHGFGLAAENKFLSIAISQDSSSLFKEGASCESIQLVKALDFIREHQITNIDLMKINIEGGEYELLEHLIDSDFVKHIQNIQVQFHDFVPNAEERMFRIQTALSVTHEITFQYQFVWENWKLK